MMHHPNICPQCHKPFVAASADINSGCRCSNAAAAADPQPLIGQFPAAPSFEKHLTLSLSKDTASTIFSFLTQDDFIRLHLVNKHFQANKKLHFDSPNLRLLPWKTPDLSWEAHCQREKFYAKFYQAQKYKACLHAGRSSSAVIANSGEVYITGRFGEKIVGKDSDDVPDHNKFTLLCSPPGARIIAAAAYHEYRYAFHVLTDKGKVYAKRVREVDAQERPPLALIEWVDITPALAADDFIISITTGHSSFLVLTAKGSVYIEARSCCHRRVGGFGFGDRKSVENLTRIPLPLGVRATAIAAGAHHFLILTDEGQVYAAGRSSAGALGFGDEYSKRIFTANCGSLLSIVNTNFHDTFKIVPLPKGIHIVDISAGEDFSYLLTNEGKVWSAGTNEEDQLGRVGGGSEEGFKPIPTEEGIYIVAMATGTTHGILLTDTDKVYTVGRRLYARTGIIKLAELPEGEIPIAIAAGRSHSLVLTQSNSILVEGCNEQGQLGLENIVAYEAKFTKVPAANFVK